MTYDNAPLEPVFLEPVPVVVDDDPGTGFDYPPHPLAVKWAKGWFATHRNPFIPEWEAERVALREAVAA